MQLIVLAAGKGSRLGRLTVQSPKVLVALPDGCSLLEHYIQILENIPQIKDMQILSGYAADKIDEVLQNRQVNKPIKVQYNPFYELSGPLISVWLSCLRSSGEDFFLCNGDTIYGVNAFQRMIDSDEDQIILGIDRNTPRCDDDMKVKIDSAGFLKRVSKKIAVEDANGVSIGLLLVKGEKMRSVFYDALDEMIHNPENLRSNVVWHSILNFILLKGHPIVTKEVMSKDWFEVDTVADLEKARQYFESPCDEEFG